jgi:hypothetical protein
MMKSKALTMISAGSMLMATLALGTGFRAAPNVGASANSRILVVSGDSVSATEGCVATSDYPRGSMIVFRAQVHTMAGHLAAPTDKVVVHLSNGMNLPMMDIHHPLPGKPMYWVATWAIPMNAKLGTLSYTITATNPKNGVHGSYAPFPAPTSLPTIVPYTYNTKVTTSVNGTAANMVKVGSTVDLAASVDQTVEVGTKLKAIPMTKGTVLAELGMAGDTTSTGALKASVSVNLEYDATTKTWDAALPLPTILPTGLYEIEVVGHDTNGNVVQSAPSYVGVEG